MLYVNGNKKTFLIKKNLGAVHKSPIVIPNNWARDKGYARDRHTDTLGS